MELEAFEARFWAKVDKNGPTVRPELGPCWLWTASGHNGYGHIWRDGSCLAAHRVSWEMHNGPIPDGLEVCHRCDVTECVNPAHLFVGTRLDNMADARSKDRLQKGRAHSLCHQRGAVRVNNSSGYKGVHFHKPSNLWHARIYIDGACRSLRYHHTPEAAGRAYDTAARELYGRDAFQNFSYPANDNGTP